MSYYLSVTVSDRARARYGARRGIGCARGGASASVLPLIFPSGRKTLKYDFPLINAEVIKW